MVEKNEFFEARGESLDVWKYVKTAFRDAIDGAIRTAVRINDSRTRKDFERFIGDRDLADLTMSLFPNGSIQSDYVTEDGRIIKVSRVDNEISLERHLKGDYDTSHGSFIPARKFPLYVVQAYPSSDDMEEGKAFSYAFTSNHRPVEIRPYT
ncbi:MAG: hypothetical protein AABX51_09185 [Nanoarchaeota archaeon]